MSLHYLKKELSCGVDVLHAEKHENLLQVDSIIFDVCPGIPKISSKFAISFWHLKKEVRNEVRDLNAQAGSNTALTIFYKSNVLPPRTVFLSQYGSHTKPFLPVINCLCNINLLLLFQVTVVPCKLACLDSILKEEKNVVSCYPMFMFISWRVILTPGQEIMAL